MKLRNEAAQPLRRANIRLGTDHAHEFLEHVVCLKETLGTAALIGEFARRLLPRAIDLAKHVIVGNERVLEHDLVEIMMPGDLVDRVAGDALRLHIDKELRETVATVFLGRL